MKVRSLGFILMAMERQHSPLSQRMTTFLIFLSLSSPYILRFLHPSLRGAALALPLASYPPRDPEGQSCLLQGFT